MSDELDVLYDVKVEVIEGVDFLFMEGSINPVLCVELDGVKKYTDIQYGTTSCTWSKNLEYTVSKIENKALSFTLFHAGFLRDVRIGSVAIGLEKLANGGSFKRKWAAIFSPSGAAKPVGYIRISVFVVRPDENMNMLSAIEDDVSDPDNIFNPDSLQLLNAPKLPTEWTMFNVRVFKAVGLPKTSGFGWIDAQVHVRAGCVQCETSVKNEENPIWNEEVSLPISLPNLNDVVQVTIRDQHQFMGPVGRFFRIAPTYSTVSIYHESFTKVFLQDLPPTWINLYGLPLSRKFRDRLFGERAPISLDELPFEPIDYYGRLLLSMTHESTDEHEEVSLLQIQPCQDPPSRKYTLWVDIVRGMHFPSSFDSVSLEVTWGNCRSQSSFRAPRDGLISWKDESYSFMNIEVPTLSIPDVIIHVYTSRFGFESRLGFIRFKPDCIKYDEREHRYPLQWFRVTPDTTSAAYDKNELAGYIFCRAILGPSDELSRIPRPDVSRSLQERLYQFRAYIYQARDLIALDENGLCDAYCKINFGNAEQKRTRKIDQNTNPCWYETIISDVLLPIDQHSAPQAFVEVYDWNPGLVDGFIGRVEVDTKSLRRRFPGNPKWHKILLDQTERGELLCSFQLLSIEEAQRMPPPKTILPRFSDCRLRIDAVGVRDMQPYRRSGFFAPEPFSRPMISFELQSNPGPRVYPDNPANDPAVPPISIRTGEQDTFFELNEDDQFNVLEECVAEVELPVEDLFLPSLKFVVFDTKDGSLAGVGSCVIPSFGVKSISEKEISQMLEKSIPLTSEERIRKLLLGGMNFSGGIPRDIEACNFFIRDEIKLKGGDLNNDENEGTSQVHDGLLPQEFSGSEYLHVPLELDPRWGKFEFLSYSLFRGISTKLGYYQRQQAQKQRNGNISLVGGKNYAGIFKGRITVERLNVSQTGLKALAFEPPREPLHIQYRAQKCRVRVHVIRGRYLSPADSDGLADPYVKVTCGEVVRSSRSQFQPRTVNPSFYQSFELKCRIPGDNLRVEVWNHNYPSEVFDELIGATNIDLEDRYFSKYWKEQLNKPIENRSLYSPTSIRGKGLLSLVVEILRENDARRQPMRSLSKPALKDFHLRVVVWETKDTSCTEQNTSDLYVRVQPQWSNEFKETDTHWKCKNIGLFHYRLCWPVTLELEGERARLKVQIWDRNILSSNEPLGEAVVDLRGFLNEAYKANRRREITQQWVTVKHPAYPGSQGSVSLSLIIVPKADQEANPMSDGRDGDDPILTTPDRPPPPWNLWASAKGLYDKVMQGQLIWWLMGILGTIGLVLVPILLQFL